MTHGEEPGSETPQDSAVLTYLEGLLMHQVAGQPGATRRPEAEQNGQEQGDRAPRAPPPTQSSTQQDKRTYPGGAPRHFKKARLLHSEAWKEPESQKLGAPIAGLNEQCKTDHAGRPDGSAAGESTLLASLLQSFSTRLQNMPLSQQTAENSKQQESKQPEAAQKDLKQDLREPALKPQPDIRGNESRQVSKETARNYGTASSRLKGLMRRGKTQNHSNVPYRQQASQDSALQGSMQRSTPDSRAAHLKAPASLAKVRRSSPALSPKPSVACSQLALLLSSEAHLQQYSREQAMKAQLSSRAASERLAAMATQKTQDKHQHSTGQPQMTPDTLSSLTSQQGTLPQPGSDSSKQSPAPVPGQSRVHSSPNTPPSFKEKRLFNKHGSRPSQNCSSLLLLLLNNHNTQKKNGADGHLEGDNSVFPVHRSPLMSDSEYSNQENSLTKDSSDAESYYSCCSPIDLSIRSRSSGPMLTSSPSSSSLEKLTESLINKWKPENHRLRVTEADELKISPDVKSTEKVTLLQLLQDHRDHKNKERLNKFSEHPLRFQHDKLPKLYNMPKGHLTPTALCEETRTWSPAKVIPDRNFQSLPTFSQGQDANGSESSYHLYTSPHVQSSPLDLCISKSYSSESVQEPPFSASKLLQNLAQCGTQNTSPSPPLSAPMPPSKRLCKGKELQTDKPVTLLERLTTPVPQSQSPVLDTACVNRGLCMQDSSPTGSEIENLLERRTVLQLLLGNTTSKEKSGGKASRVLDTGCIERQPDKPVSCDRFSGPLLDIKVKVEPEEESQQSEDAEGGRTSRSENGTYFVSHQDVKLESVSADLHLKDGLLSQLLKQQPRQYHTNMQTDACVGRVSKEHHRPVLPKKRRICLELESHLNGSPCHTLASRDTYADAGTAGDHLDPTVPERHNVTKAENPQQADLSASCLLSESQPKDSRTFNVLKQLLLSDNCLRDLAQPRGTTSRPSLMVHCKANGNVPLGACHDFASMQQPRVPGMGTVDLKMSTSDSPWGYQPLCQDFSRESPVSYKRESDDPIRWAVSGEEKRDSDSGSPRLTKSNPILYYMLQKGHNHLRKGPQTPQGEMEHYEFKVKEEPEVDLKVQDNELNLKHNWTPHKVKQDKDVGQMNGSLEKC